MSMILLVSDLRLLGPSSVESASSLESADTLSSFKIRLKTFLFDKTFSYGWIR